MIYDLVNYSKGIWMQLSLDSESGSHAHMQHLLSLYLIAIEFMNRQLNVWTDSTKEALHAGREEMWKLVIVIPVLWLSNLLINDLEWVGNSEAPKCDDDTKSFRVGTAKKGQCRALSTRTFLNSGMVIKMANAVQRKQISSDEHLYLLVSTQVYTDLLRRTG